MRTFPFSYPAASEPESVRAGWRVALLAWGQEKAAVYRLAKVVQARKSCSVLRAAEEAVVRAKARVDETAIDYVNTILATRDVPDVYATDTAPHDGGMGVRGDALEVPDVRYEGTWRAALAQGETTSPAPNI